MSVVVIEKATKNSQGDVKPNGTHADGGLQPRCNGKRIRFSGDQCAGVDGPFAQAKELIGGFWI